MIDYKLAESSWGSEEYSAIQDIIKSGRFTMGPKVREFEKGFAKKIGRKYAVMVNSGSSANLLAIAALELPKESKVIVPPLGWSTTYSPFYFLGYKMFMAGIDPFKLNIDDEGLEIILNKNKDIRAICVVNVLGNPCNFKKIKELCDYYKLYLIEDNCESLGATYNGKQCGTFGDVSTFSFFFSHHLQTMEGGMVVTDNKIIYDKLIVMRAHGWTRELEDSNIFMASNKDQFKFVMPGFNLRPTEMSGAIGVEQLKKWDKFIETRQNNANAFISTFGMDERFRIQSVEENSESSWFGFSLLYHDISKSPGYVKKIREFLESNGVETRPILMGNILNQEVFKYYNFDVGYNTTTINYLSLISDYGFFLGNSNNDITEKIAETYKLVTDHLERI